MMTKVSYCTSMTPTWASGQWAFCALNKLQRAPFCRVQTTLVAQRGDFLGLSHDVCSALWKGDRQVWAASQDFREGGNHACGGHRQQLPGFEAGLQTLRHPQFLRAGQVASGRSKKDSMTTPPHSHKTSWTTSVACELSCAKPERMLPVLSLRYRWLPRGVAQSREVVSRRFNFGGTWFGSQPRCTSHN